MESSSPISRAPRLPRFIAERRWWLIALIAWGVCVGLSLRSHQLDLERQALEVATEGARNMFRMIVLTRTWNAEHGGVYVPVSDQLSPNPYLEHPRRDIVTKDGQHLTLVNPAFMTRLISELAQVQNSTTFHITSRKPIRPANAPDEWEQGALLRFEAGSREEVALLPEEGKTGRQLRYMAPLQVGQACLSCHQKQGYQLGDIRGGISVSQPFSPVESALQPAHRQARLNHLAIFLLVVVLGGILLELLRRRWLGLGESIASLEAARSELQTANQALEQARGAAEAANIAKSAFLSNMSHEFRTPLNAITGFAHVLREEVEEPAQRAHAETILHASDRLLEMVNLLLDLAQAETGELQIRPDAFELSLFVDKLYAGLQRETQAKGLGCRLDMPTDKQPCWLKGDVRRIGQLLGQFLHNAVKFSEAGTVALRVDLQPVARGRLHLHFEVADQGIGISAVQQQQLFGLFHQVDASVTRSHGGNGVGLTICKRLAELMGGQVGVSSQPGVGSRFWFEVELEALASIERPVPVEAARPVVEMAFDQVACRAGLTHLSELLAEGDFAVRDWWRDHAADLAPCLGEQAAVVDQDIAEFRFDVALATVREALRLLDAGP